MPLPLKTQILNQILSLLEPLKADGTVAVIERRLSPVADGGVMPLIHVVEGQERQIAADTRGRTYQFPILLKLLLEDGVTKAELKDEIVARIVEILEAPENLQLGGLVANMDAVEETPYVSELTGSKGGALLLFEVTYRRERGKPRQQY